MKKYKLESLELNDEVRKNADGSFIDLPSGNTHYKIEGNENGKWCVLTHGYATPLFIYDKIAAGLVENGYRVLRYDLLGRGLSERVEKEYNPTLFANQLHELTEALIPGEKFYLFGTSMGGSITTTFTSMHPEKVEKLVLYAPAGMHFKAPFYMKLAKIKGIGECMFYTIGMKILVKGCAKEMLYSGQAVKEQYMEQFAYCAQYKGMAKATLSSLRNTILNFDETHKGYVGTDKAGIKVLTIWGTIDKTMPYYQSEEMKQILKNMTLVTFEESGHIFLYDQAEKTLDVTLPFLKEE
ncbi:MAG: alpha/beta hydrolase [Clostridia bacterium]|nr:alpha/beta hydrolase [Clostridia bacterium]